MSIIKSERRPRAESVLTSGTGTVPLSISKNNRAKSDISTSGDQPAFPFLEWFDRENDARKPRHIRTAWRDEDGSLKKPEFPYQCLTPVTDWSKERPSRCKHCPNCFHLRKTDIIAQARCEMLSSDATYFVTLTWPAGTPAFQARHDFTQFRYKARTALDRDHAAYSFLKTVEYTKKGTLHLHLLFHITGDHDIEDLRQAHEHISDIRLIHGQGWDLDGHISPQNRHLYTKERREDPGLHVPYGYADQGTATIFYITKYVGKTLGEERKGQARSQRSFDRSNYYGDPGKLARMYRPGITTPHSPAPDQPGAWYFTRMGSTRPMNWLLDAIQHDLGLQTIDRQRFSLKANAAKFSQWKASIRGEREPDEKRQVPNRPEAHQQRVGTTPPF